jgi:hypothetical protein
VLQADSFSEQLRVEGVLVGTGSRERVLLDELVGQRVPDECRRDVLPMMREGTLAGMRVPHT